MLIKFWFSIRYYWKSVLHADCIIHNSLFVLFTIQIIGTEVPSSDSPTKRNQKEKGFGGKQKGPKWEEWDRWDRKGGTQDDRADAGGKRKDGEKDWKDGAWEKNTHLRKEKPHLMKPLQEVLEF